MHVLYFWHEPAGELASIRAALRPRRMGRPRLRAPKRHASGVAEQFPEEGHRLYGADHEVAALLTEADFHDIRHMIEELPVGRSRRLAVGRA